MTHKSWWLIFAWIMIKLHASLKYARLITRIWETSWLSWVSTHLGLNHLRLSLLYHLRLWSNHLWLNRFLWLYFVTYGWTAYSWITYGWIACGWIAYGINTLQLRDSVLLGHHIIVPYGHLKVIVITVPTNHDRITITILKFYNIMVPNTIYDFI